MNSVDDADGHSFIQRVVMDNNRAFVKQILPEPGTLLLFSAPIGLVFTFRENFCNSDDVKGSNKWDPADSSKLDSIQ